jgi:LPXTG-site transpeptidase (sortase) family protein
LFLPTTPTRVLDTRTFVPLIPWKGSTFEFGIGRSTDAVSAAALNLTGVDPWIGGYVTLYPAGQPRPFVSNLNLTTFNQIIANHAIVRVGQRGVDVFTQNGVHLVADVAGWYLGTPSSSPLVKPPNPLYYPNKAASVQIPSLGIWIPIETGPDLDAIATRGHAAAFGDQVDVAEKGNIMLFGHRTSSTHPFLYLNLLKPGQTFMIYGSDGHRYTYMVVRNDITSPNYLTIQNIGTSVAPVTAQLIACHPLHYVYQRIVVTGRLISVD